MQYSELFKQWQSNSESIECQTSGSTGLPKLIYLPKREMTRSAERTIRFFCLQPGATLYSCISPDYIGGKMMGIRALALGYDPCRKDNLTRFCYETPSNRPLSDVEAKRIDLLAVVPSQMQWILHHLEQMPEFGAILVGGSAIPKGLRQEIEASGLPAWESYGMTETSSHIALRKISATPTPFKPLSGISVSSNDGALTIEMEGWQKIATNDIVHIYADGSFEILGRKDNVIISGGKKIQPETLEETLRETLGIEVAITSREDEKWGEKVVLVLEKSELSDEEILNICKKLLANHLVPKEIIRHELPRTETGKISRKLLKVL